MSFYQRLQAETQQERNRLLSSPIIQDALRGEITLSQYVAFLTQAYHHVKHTVPLLMSCGGRLPEHYEWLREAVAEYIEEERGHQEWILNDIAVCGGDKEEVRRSRPHLTTELMVAYAYDTVMRINPLGFFGMVHVLEGVSVTTATQAGEIIQKTLGLPNQAFSYLFSHGSLDQEHIRFFEDLMNKIKRHEDQQAILHASKVFYELYGAVFRALPRNHERGAHNQESHHAA
ncbi:iron-containing redox enzyme family protein [Hahella aquimaris]|uniref:TenA family transcriptional regulator n=1 Tax=Hahella sp. HNIBRBA332 TaxID=3015983 RepID=UPI00273C2386|nr:iron-containing redox enzyme family protein [Hahella sp. HNIBRBA332]WLQ13490.1 iron-containing redox enzyme family protein [Hahella sp. HNIBRBA332]